MKRIKKITIFSILTILVIGLVYNNISAYSIMHTSIKKSTKKIGRLNSHKAYELGSNVYGQTVFKSPSKALKQANVDYKEVFNALENKIPEKEITNDNFYLYKLYAKDLINNNPNINQKVYEHSTSLIEFVKVYKNSFSSGQLDNIILNNK